MCAPMLCIGLYKANSWRRRSLRLHTSSRAQTLLAAANPPACGLETSSQRASLAGCSDFENRSLS